MIEIIKNNWRKILIVLLILLLSSLIYVGFFYKAKYQVSATLILGACETECNTSDYSMITVNDKLLPNYVQLTKNYEVLMDVITKLELDYSLDELSSMIKVVTKDGTQMFEIVVTSNTSGEVVKIINQLTESLVLKVKEIYKMDNLKILDVSLSEEKVNLIIYIYIVIGLIVLLIFLVILIHCFDRYSIKKKKEKLDDKKELSLDEIKELSFEMLKYIREVCEENSLKYYIYGGTLLGAVKYNGFIPWDDDIDVVLLREDYMKLMDILSKKDDRYKLLSIYNRKDYYYQFAKLVDSKTILVEDAKKIDGMGVYVDIIPIDGVPDENVDKFYKKIKLLRKFATARWCSNNSKENKFTFKNQKNKSDKSLKISLIKANIFNIVTMPLGLKFFAKRLDKLASKYAYSATKNVCRLVNGYGIREMVETKEFQKQKKYVFEGEKFTSIKNADVILSKLYGDYKNDPPIEEQRTHHNLVAYWKD